MNEFAPRIDSKLAPPLVHAEVLMRPRLIDRLELVPGGSTALVVAGPGWGKSVLLAQWASSTAGPVAWFTVDARDNDLARFWSHLSAAVGEAGSAPAGATVADGSVDSVLSMLPRLGRLTVVLDDVDLITTPALLADLRLLLKGLPSTARFLLAGRGEPPIDLARLRPEGRLVEIREDDLRLTPRETAQLATAVLGDDRSAHLLYRRTEGWPAGTQLALRAAGQAPDPSRFLTEFSGSHLVVSDYLIEEVLRAQPPDVQQLLIDCSILRRLTPPLCAAVSGQPDAAAVLGELARTHVLVTRIDTPGADYRIHQLFADLLRGFLAADPGRAAQLHGRAAEWFEADGDIATAIDHFLDAGDHQNAARLVGPHIHEYFQRGRSETLLDWIDQIPKDTFPAGAWELARLWATITAGDWVASAALLNEGPVEPDQDPVMAAELAAAGAFIASRNGRVDVAGDCASQALRLFGVAGVSGDHGAARLAAQLSIRCALLEGDVDRARSVLESWLSTAGAPVEGASVAFGSWARVLHAAGDDEGALRAADTALRADDLDERWGVTIDALLARAGVHRRRCDLDDAAVELQRALAIARQTDNPGDEVAVLTEVLLVRVDQGDIEAARAVAAHALELVDTLGMSPRLRTRIERCLGDSSPGRRVGPLTERELEVLDLLPSRLTNAEIADQLCVSVNTVKHHTKSIYRKLETDSRDGAIDAAKAAQLLR